MTHKYAKKDARRAAFCGATQWDADVLNPYLSQKLGAHNADTLADVWRQEFLHASKSLTDMANYRDQDVQQ